MSAPLSRVRELQPFMACRETNQKVVIGKTSGHQPATLRVRGSTASILASMETVTSLEPFIARTISKRSWRPGHRLGGQTQKAPRPQWSRSFASLYLVACFRLCCFQSGLVGYALFWTQVWKRKKAPA
ncbi:hypothetical protein [Rhizobium leguminosarum]